MIPAARNADNNFGKMPRMGEIGMGSLATTVMRTSVRLAIVWTTRNHDIDVTTVRLPPAITAHDLYEQLGVQTKS